MMSAPPDTQQVLGKFIWAQWDVSNQQLYVLLMRFRQGEDKPTPILRCLEFNSKTTLFTKIVSVSCHYRPFVLLHNSEHTSTRSPFLCLYFDLQSIKRCDLWHHMFTKEPQSLDFLQARFVHSSMEENITSYIIWRLHCLILINFWYDERGHISKLVKLLLS